MNSPVLQQLLRDNPVVITGAGAVCAAGDSPTAIWRRALAGQPTAQFQEFDFAHSQRSFAVGIFPDLESRRAELRPVHRADRSTQLAWLAATQALDAAGLSADTEGIQSAGIWMGTTRGPIAKISEGMARVGSRRYPPSLSTECTFAAGSGALAQKLGLHGPGGTISATCASGAYAIAIAAEQILLGKSEIMLAGAAEAPLVPSLLAQLEAAGVMGSHPEAGKTCRPFDLDRNGLSVGEGSAFLVLESLHSAQRRGRRPLARLAGWGLHVDNGGRAGVSDSAKGLVQCANHALALAGLAPDDIDYVNAHGTGTILNDRAEAAAVRQVFGARAARLPCSSTKPITGHCLGATAALEAIICIEALRYQTAPPTANCPNPDPACGVNCLPDEALHLPLTHVMSQSLGFWGYHASLIFTKITD